MRTSYRDVGHGEPIVALHGIPTSSAIFMPLVPHLEGYRLIAPDLLGQGQTETPANGRLDFAAYYHHLEAFLDEVAPASFHLLVHDFGAVLGLTWATAHAQRLQSIVVLSTPASMSLRLWLLYAVNLVFGARGLHWLLIPWTLRRASTVTPEVLREWTAPWTRRRLLRGLDHFGPRHLRDLRQRLALLTRPVLLLWGQDDDVFPISHGEALRTALPHAQLVTIPKCGHWTPLDASAEVAQNITAFCALHRVVER